MLTNVFLNPFLSPPSSTLNNSHNFELHYILLVLSALPLAQASLQPEPQLQSFS